MRLKQRRHSWAACGAIAFILLCIATSCRPTAADPQPAEGELTERRQLLVPKEAQEVKQLAFLRDNDRLIGAADQIHIWSVREGKLVRSLSRAGEAWARGFDISPDQSEIVVSYSDGAIVIWDLRKGEPLLEFNAGETAEVRFYQGGRRIVTLTGDSNNKTLRTWDRGTGEQLAEKKIGFWTIGLAVSPAGAIAVTCGARQRDAEGQPVLFWDLDSLAPVLTVRAPTGHGTLDPTFSPGGERVALPMLYGPVYVLDASTGELVHTLALEEATPRKMGGFCCAAFSPTTDRLAAGVSGFQMEEGMNCPTLVVWKSDDGQRSASADIGDAVTAVAFSPNGKLLAAAVLPDPAIHVFSVRGTDD